MKIVCVRACKDSFKAMKVLQAATKHGGRAICVTPIVGADVKTGRAETLYLDAWFECDDSKEDRIDEEAEKPLKGYE